ncbi:TonB-dependent receptor domain-containing protein [Oceanobacter sp. 4_MG-2023]|uniref:TonB-dependent receptor domain-containing protein n=1 Tax=Oceanobacter sp. 4_MG-2023 TaxID=3062623 RepID=UPI002735E428|nr:TonB-dependent receptor [Oceanobacter sp. 4_MG-2023]MDP2548713.1 TonB-dependent receptor [Oceanobacter sp. 4_MG-2023]
MRAGHTRLITGTLGLLIASPLWAAGIKVDFVMDGQPVGDAIVLEGGLELGRTDANGSLWIDSVDGGRKALVVEAAGTRIPVSFTLDSDEAAFVSISKTSGVASAEKSVKRIPLSQLSHRNGQVSSDDGALVGVIEGAVTDDITGAAIANVVVSVEGSDITTRTDGYGTYEIQLPAGNYRLTLQHPDYRGQTLSGVKVVSQLSVNLETNMSSSDDGYSQGIEEVVATASYQPYNPVDMERMSSSVLDSMDFTQIARFDDSTVSSALKRVVGVSLEDSRYAIVRGMKSRYQSTYFNGAVLPATDPARRDLPLDIFPASIMQTLSLQKSATADVPGTATAGHIEMKTKPTPDEGFFKISATLGYGKANSEEGYMSKESGGSDWTGYDDGFREMPDIAKEARGAYFFGDPDSAGSNGLGYSEEFLQYREDLGESFENYGVYKGDLPADVSFSLAGGDSWLTEDGQRLGVIGAFRYSNKWTNDEKIQNGFDLYTVNNSDTGEQEDIIALTSSKVTYDTNNIIDLSAMLNADWRITENHTLGINNLLLRHTTSSAEFEDQYNIASGYWIAQNDIVLPEDPRDWAVDSSIEKFQTQSIDWIEEQLVSHQLWGEHYFNISEVSGLLGNLKANWQVARSSSEYDRPNAQRYTYQGSQTSDPTLLVGYSTAYNLWEYSEEDGNASSIDLELPINETGNIAVTAKAGLYKLDRTRDGYEDRFSYRDNMLEQETREDILLYPDPADIFTDEYIGDGTNGSNGLYVNYGGSLNDEDDIGIDNGYQYRVEQHTNAMYLQTDWNLWNTVTANLGVRRESFKVEADQYYYNPEPLYELLDETKTLPSVGATWLINERWQLRGAFSKTVSWPETFELLPRTYRDIETLTAYKGNPDLKPADIKNYDMRLEWYPSDTESVSLGAYRKDMDNPIENAFDTIGNDYDYYTFVNVDSGKVSGWELDFRTEFDLGYSHAFFVQGNYTDIESEVTLAEDSKETDLDRPLQGQPDYIANLQLGYDHIETGQEVTLVFNRKGKELVIVTPDAGSNVTNVYSEPYDDLKIIYTKRFGDDLKVSLSGENILDSEKRQYYEKYNVAYLSYKSGPKYKLKVSYDF